MDAIDHIVEFLIIPSCSYAVILGWDFLSAPDAVIDCGSFLLDLSETVQLVSTPPSLLKLSCEKDASLPPCASIFLSVRAPERIDAKVLLSPAASTVTKRGILVPYACITSIINGIELLMVANPGFAPVFIRQGTVLAFASTDDGIFVSSMSENVSSLSEPGA